MALAGLRADMMLMEGEPIADILQSRQIIQI